MKIKISLEELRELIPARHVEILKKHHCLDKYMRIVKQNFDAGTEIFSTVQTMLKEQKQVEELTTIQIFSVKLEVLKDILNEPKTYKIIDYIIPWGNSATVDHEWNTIIKRMK